MDSKNLSIEFEANPDVAKMRYSESDECFVFENPDYISWDIETIRKHFDRIQKILIKEYIILKYYECQPELKTFLNSLEKELIQYALMFSSGAQNRAAELLSVKPTCLFEKMKKFNIKSKKKDLPDHRHNILKEMDLFIIHLKKSLL
jgi:DNA-binding protein Fis